MSTVDNVLAGKVAVITGASAGIGAAVAHRLSGHGVRLGLGSRRGTDLGLPDALGAKCDVRDAAQVERLVADTADRFGRIDILIANAGVGSYGAFLDVPAENVDEMVDTNFKGTLYLLRAGIPYLKSAGGGDVVAIASEAGRRGLPYEAAYSASKFGQVGFLRAMDHELREDNIRTSNICPGGVATDFAMGDGRGRTPDMPALADMMSADDVADVVEFVLTRRRGHRILEVAMRPMSEQSWG